MSKIPVNLDPREEKKHIAAGIRERLNERRILAVNLISSPGSGKTTLLEQVLPGLSKELRLAIIEADNATRYDADRLEASGLTVEMIANAITGCHISPAGALKAFNALDLDNLELKDPATFEVFANGDTVGIFQFESPGMRTISEN